MPTTTATAHLSPVPRRGAAAPPSVEAAARSTRARRLRAQARDMNPLVAQAYIRRAVELERAAGAWSGGPTVDGAPAAA